MRVRVRDRVRVSCDQYWPALLELLGDPAGATVAGPARDHLEACGRCRSEVAGLVLASYAVRRTFAEAARARPPADAWPQLVKRIQRAPARPGRAASPILALALGAGLATGLLLPLGAMPGGRTMPIVIQEQGLDPAAITAAERRDAQDEARRLRAAAVAGKGATSPTDTGPVRAIPIRYEQDTARDSPAALPRPFSTSVE